MEEESGYWNEKCYTELSLTGTKCRLMWTNNARFSGHYSHLIQMIKYFFYETLSRSKSSFFPNI